MDQQKFSKDFACTHRKYLPCPFAYRDEEDSEVYRCNYDRLWVLAALINGDEQYANTLTNKACPPIKREVKFSEFLKNIHRQYAYDIIKNAKTGDLVFCFDEIDGEVILLEKPDDILGRCLYRNKKGQVKSCPVVQFRTISKGNFAAKYLAKGNESEIDSMMIKRMAGEAGFRVEVERAEMGHQVKIFGDNQQEVDDFMTMCVYNKFILY